MRTLCAMSLVFAVWVGGPSSSYGAPAPGSPQTDGYFVVRLVSNAPSIGIFFNQFNSLELAPAGPKAKSRRFAAAGASDLASVPPVRPTAVFGGWLPPGSYRLKAFQATAGALSTGLQVPESFPAFSIAAGAVTDLGVVILQPVEDGNAVLFPASDPGQTPDIIRSAFAGDAQILGSLALQAADLSTGWSATRQGYGGASGAYGGLVGAMIVGAAESTMAYKPANEWSQTSTPSEFLAGAKRTTTLLSNPAVATDGTMVFGSALGQVLRRSPDGVWSVQDTGNLGAITAVTLDGTALVLGTEFGAVLRSSNDGSTFSVIGRVPDSAAIVDIHRLDTGEWIVAARSVKDEMVVTSVYAGAAPDQLSGSPGKVTSQRLGPGFWKGVTSWASVAGTGSAYVLYLPGKAPEIYSAKDRAWAAAPGKSKPLSISSSGDGNAFVSAGPEYVSIDDGQTWSPVKLSGAVQKVMFFDRDNAVAILATDRMTWSGTQEIRASRDGGNSWSKVNELPKAPCNINTVKANYVQKRLFCIMRDGSLRSTTVDGEWSIER